jgi:hypothetical protein
LCPKPVLEFTGCVVVVVVVLAEIRVIMVFAEVLGFRA